MGVPGFFAWLIRQRGSNKILLDELKTNGGDVSSFYIDSNCLFHPQCFNLLKHYPDETSAKKLEKRMIERIMNYLDYIIGYVNPQNLVYISVDGVAPLAKINQQRKRRFRAIDDLKIKNSIKQRHNIPINDVWSNTVITPGTDFMERLHVALDKHIKERYIGKTDCKFIYSSYHTNGEGEHKILQHIKKNKPKGNTVVYGLDADLFFLSMASGFNDIYLLREAREIDRNVPEADIIDPVTDVAEPLTYASVDETVECALNIIRNTANKKIKGMRVLDLKYNNDLLRKDFVLMCYLLGNDFLPHFPSIDVKKGGLDIIIDIYTDMLIKHRVNIMDKHNKINNEFLYDLILGLAQLEQEYFTVILPKDTAKRRKWKCEEQDPYAKDLWKLEHMKLFKIDDPIQLGQGEVKEWKDRYYNFYFGDQSVVSALCQQYIEGIVWVTKYYFEECPDYMWQYVHTHAPFLSDMAQYMTDHKETHDINKIVFKRNQSFEPMQQLLGVLHPESRNMLPRSYRYLVHSDISPILDLYPTDIKLDMINKDLFWQCIPMISSIEPSRIVDATRKLELTPEETIRNTCKEDLIY